MRMEIRELMKAVNKDGHNYYTEIYVSSFMIRLPLLWSS